MIISVKAPGKITGIRIRRISSKKTQLFNICTYQTTLGEEADEAPSKTRRKPKTKEVEGKLELFLILY